MGKIKRLPYGIADFEDLRKKERYCVDKTMFIPELENAADFLFLIRPRRFGKSVFLSMLRDYYDMSRQDRFGELFEGLWIADHPTELRGKYQVIFFDFSQITPSGGSLQEYFHKYCSIKLKSFAETNASHYGSDFVDQVNGYAPNSSAQLIYICDQAKKRGIDLYLIIDEYDNFTNNVLNERGEAVYHALTHATGFYRDVFKIYKANFSRILMMGVSPVTMDDVTSGFNIALNITADPRFNRMLGFSETEVREMIGYYQGVGMIREDMETLIADMKPWYDNYCFAEECLCTDPPMFNTDMVLYYLNSYCNTGRAPRQMIDNNTRTDYTKLKKLMVLDGAGVQQKGIIRRIASEGKIMSTINLSFPAERIFNKENFVSLLYYYGMLTITGSRGIQLELSIPNNNVRKQYYEYMLEEYQSEIPVEISDLVAAFGDMAFDGKWEGALRMMADSYKEHSSVRSGIEGERNIQGFYTAYLSLNAYYHTAPEVELNHGFCDIFLMPDKMRYPTVSHSYILELKYLPSSSTEEKAVAQWQEAVAQIHRYAEGEKVRLMCADTELHLIIMQIRGFDLIRMEEVCQL